VSGERITWLGHSTVLVEVGGARLITDPVLRPRIAHLRRHAGPLTAPGRLDAVLLSHLHRDHLDLPTLRRLDPSAPIVVPRGAARHLADAGREVVEVEIGETIELGGARVRAFPAVHDGRRSPLGGAAGGADTLGYVVEGRSRVYFPGDTELFAGMAELSGQVDAALLPVWGWGSSVGAGHMDPGQAAQAAAVLRPRLAVPIHWGTFLPMGLARRHGHLLRGPGPAFARRAAEAAPGVRVEVLRPGEGVDLHDPPPGRRQNRR
jgi:L-ascorbate metabolism protein UlaG (beta-lactamase superfamily)